MVPVSGGFSAFGAQPSHRCPSRVEDQAVHVAGEVGQRDPGLGAFDADGAEKQPPLLLGPGEHVFDTGTDLRFCGIGPGGAFGHRPAARLLRLTRPCRLSPASLAWLR